MITEDSHIAGRLVEHLADRRHLAFAIIAPDLTLARASANFAAVATGPIDAERPALADVLLEFVGAEGMLRDILAGAEPSFRLDHVARERPDGAPLYLTFEVIPLETAVPQNGLLLLVQDTTRNGTLEQRLVQERNELRLARAALADANAELTRLNRLKSLFLSMAAHDLRTPLTVIQGFAQLLAMDLSPEPSEATSREYLETITAQVEWLDRLIVNLLALDQIEEGKLALRPTACIIDVIGQEVLDAMQALALSKRQRLTLEPADAPTQAFADPERVRQILYNLLGNAIKYTPPQGHIRLRLGTENGMAVVAVADNGRGMTATEQAQLFELYYRTNDAARSKVKGTGLGLFIVKTLAEAQNGHIDVHSAPGEGTTFTVRLPGRPPAG